MEPFLRIVDPTISEAFRQTRTAFRLRIPRRLFSNSKAAPRILSFRWDSDFRFAWQCRADHSVRRREQNDDSARVTIRQMPTRNLIREAGMQAATDVKQRPGFPISFFRGKWFLIS